MRSITVGIDIGTHGSRVIVGEYNDGESLPSVIGMGVSESRGLRHGYVTNKIEAEKSTRKALVEAERASKIKIRRAFASVGGLSLDSILGTGTAIISKADGEVTELDVKKAIAESEESLGTLQNRRILHTIPIKWKLDGKEILGRPVGMHGVKLEVKTIFITCLEQHLNDLVEVIEEAGVEVIDVVASPIAASLVTLNKRQKTAGSVLVNIGAETVSMVVFENDTPTFLHVFPIGGTDITNDIALGLKIPIEEAEEIKLGGMLATNYSRRKLDEIIEARLTDIFELVENYLKKIGRSGLLPAGIVLTGGGAQLSLIGELAKETLKLPSRITTPDLFQNSKGKIKDSTWSVAYGLLLLSNTLSQDKDKFLNSFLRKVKTVLNSSLKELLP
ncbi:MAG: cell division protein FtsA [Candidatus Lloydbacteria bacterium RIFCSPHIGHO2_01_FULL_41_20]|uniref:Cell division protein FtsA n=1 Tax=Candidatus Lloydbacteria bacterium RIFCSPHIGHO2_01_FULL_41_20 TaxID=1798657 RepID=A0A1G2CUT4_9BACT|nr:MAG: cell division protein FtsA [Candidatus Lloydbacteria bacterium RIFCSPHIGHO2_01_FULL_41_20]